MPSVSRPAIRVAALAALAFAAGACTTPQSGSFADHWCKTTGDATLQLLDDMEDGDGKACQNQGSWSVTKGEGGGETTPSPGPILKSDDLSEADLTARGVGLRALHLTGTGFQEGEWAALRIDLADGDLSPYDEIQFWARSDAPGLEVRVAVATDTTAGSDTHWGIPVTVTQQWGDGQGKPFSFPLIGEGDMMVPEAQKDLAHSQALEFQVHASAGVPSFGFWIDDIVLKRRPPAASP